MNFGESLTIQASRFPEKTAIEDDHKSITYGRLNSRVNSLTHGLIQTGLKKGDIVCHLQRNTVEHMELLFALAKGGMIRLPLNPRGNSAEFAYLINSFEPDALVFEEDFAGVIATLRPTLK